jgi:hypothetical protein
MTQIQPAEFLNLNLKSKINQLSSQHEQWCKHMGDGDKLLYALLDSCLKFHDFLIANESYQTPFKDLCLFHWNRNTSMMTLVVKQVFGASNKSAYPYIKALNLALQMGIGKAGNLSLSAWLKSNGGIAGVTKPKSNASRAQAERDFRIHLAHNYSALGQTLRVKPFKSETLVKEIQHGSKEIVVLLSCDHKTQEFQTLFMSEHPIRVREMLEDMGDAIIHTSGYRKHREEYLGSLMKRNAVAAEELKEMLLAPRNGKMPELPNDDETLFEVASEADEAKDEAPNTEPSDDPDSLFDFGSDSTQAA